MIDVLSQPCPNCQAPVGEACTAADNYSRHPVKRVHGARIQAVHDAEYLATDAVAPVVRDTAKCIEWGSHLASALHRRDECPAEPVVPILWEDPAPDMSEAFQWDAEVESEAERRYPFSDGWDGGSYADNARQRICRAAFIDGAQWGSRPF